jgi:two-component system phosphate regulon sensor histidine kinase PhoR
MSWVRLRWIILLMSLALVGLIVFQWFWIETVLSANEERFYKDVNEALLNVVEKLERQEAIFQVNQQLVKSRSIEQIQKTLNSSSSSLQFFEVSGAHDSIEFGFYFSMDAFGNISFSTRPGKNGNSNQLREVTEESAIGRINNKSEMLIAALEDLVSPRNLSRRINSKLLDSLINHELREKGISLPFYFGVIKPLESSFVVLDQPSYQEDLKNSEFKASLFPNDLIVDPSILTLYFPEKSKYLVGQIWLTLSSSAILVLLILFCFGYAVFAIVKQKNISELKSDFINNMTHEFKTPIATIGLAAEALQDASISANSSMRQRYLGIIGEENDRLGYQVEKVLQIAQIDRKELQLTKGFVDLHDIIEKAAEKMAIQIENTNGTLKMDLRAQHSQLNLDSEHILSVLINLLDNAIKYSEDQPNIMIRTATYKNELHLTVKDHGIGMSRDQVKQIFHRFYRVPSGNLHNVKGFGLGLAYVKSIVEMHGGTVEVESESGHGSMFTLKFQLEDEKV